MCSSDLTYRNIGVQLLLDSIVSYLPSPLDGKNAAGIIPGSEETLDIVPDAGEPFAALIFKIVSDRHVGKLAFARVYSGTIKAGSYVINSSKTKKERVGRLVKMHANHREEITQVSAGDIVAFIGLKDVSTGDTLCEEGHNILLESIAFPEPVIQIAIEPKTQNDQSKLGEALAKLASEDPTFKVMYNQ